MFDVISSPHKPLSAPSRIKRASAYWQHGSATGQRNGQQYAKRYRTRNAPAGKAQDIIVTNPQTNDPPDQQNQSGLLAGSFNILLNPKFQPTTQFATVNQDNSFSVYDIGQRTMLNVQTAQGDSFLLWPAFNIDGKELYIESVQAKIRCASGKS